MGVSGEILNKSYDKPSGSLKVKIVSGGGGGGGSTAAAFNTQQDTFTSVSSGVTIDASTAPVKFFSIQVKMTGTVTSWDLRLEGSNDNVEFTQILQHTNSSPGDGVTMYSGSAATPCLYFRTRCAGLTLGAGTNIIATVLGMA